MFQHLQSQRKFLQNGIQKRFDSLQSFVQTKYDIIALDIEALNNTVTKIENNMDAEPTDEVIKRNNNGYGFCV
jgi:hypothetical protein